jgi:purine-binding chemotaxis protein CheW
MSEWISSKANNADNALKNQYLTFWADGQLFGVSIVNVMQIIRMQKIVEIPDYPSYAKGIINLRGSIVPILDIRMRLGKPQVEYSERTCIVIIDVREKLYGIAVDLVNEVMEILPENISPPPQMDGVSVSEYLSGITKLDEKVVMVLDCSSLLKEEELEKLTSAAKT